MEKKKKANAIKYSAFILAILLCLYAIIQSASAAESAVFYVAGSSVGRKYLNEITSAYVSSQTATTATVYGAARGMNYKHNFTNGANVGHYTVYILIGNEASNSVGPYSWTYGSGKCNGTWFSCGHYTSTAASYTYAKRTTDFTVTVYSKTYNASTQRDYNKNNNKSYTSRAPGYFTAASSVNVTVPRLKKVTVKYHGNGATYDNTSGASVDDVLSTVDYYYNQNTLATYGLCDYNNGGTWDLYRENYDGTGNWIVGSPEGTVKISQSTPFATVQAMVAAAGTSWDGLSDITLDLYADWKLQEGTLTYDANGHGTAPEDQTLIYTEGSVVAGELSEDGYTFKEWNTKADGTGTGYSAGSTYKEANTLNNINGVQVIPHGETLYAIWKRPGTIAITKKWDDDLEGSDASGRTPPAISIQGERDEGHATP